MLTVGRKIDETAMGRYYSLWAMIQTIRSNAISGHVLAALHNEEESLQVFKKIILLIDKK
jgi:hypothetical protein